MKTFMKKALLALAGVAIILFAPATTNACTTPVWRYALERWWPDPYRVEIETSGELTTNQQKAVDLLTSAWEDEKLPANAIAQSTTAPSAETATISVYYPLQGRHPAAEEEQPLWEAELTLENAKKTLYSPFRHELATAIGSGENVVWFLLESGKEQADQEAMQLLEDTLEKKNKSYEEYRIDENRMATNQWANAYTLPALEFTSTSLSRDNPREQFFINSLLESEPGLASTNQPMIFAVFGKGRCLPALPGDEITAENINMYNNFMGGACSCQVKYRNPGFDLLLTINWKEAFYNNEEYVEDVTPTLTSVMAAAPAETNAPTAAEVAAEIEQEESAEEVETGGSLNAIIIGVLAGGLAIVGLGSLMLARNKKRK